MKYTAKKLTKWAENPFYSLVENRTGKNTIQNTRFGIAYSEENLHFCFRVDDEYIRAITSADNLDLSAEERVGIVFAWDNLEGHKNQLEVNPKNARVYRDIQKSHAGDEYSTFKDTSFLDTHIKFVGTNYVCLIRIPFQELGMKPNKIWLNAYRFDYDAENKVTCSSLAPTYLDSVDSANHFVEITLE